jgi:4-hydroxy-tetrahydrodipicolinate synthase
MKSLIEAFVSGRTSEAASIHRHLLPLMSALMTVSTNPMPIKHALNQVGFNAGPFRLPLCDLDEAQSARLMAEVRKVQIDLPVSV